MKLQELAQRKVTQTIEQVFESYFGNKIAFSQLTRRHTNHMLERVQGILGEHRNSLSRHTSQQNPDYLKLVMLEQALSARLAEMTPPPNGSGTITSTTTTPPAGTAKPPVDPKIKAAQDKLKKGMTLTTDEQKAINAQVAAMQENRLSRAFKVLKESEVQQAQVVLAAQDMVDNIQGMLEDVSELQFKELPALVDSIRNQVGMDQAQQFNTDASAALSGLVQNLQTAKASLESALGVVTGQASAAPMTNVGAAMPDADAGAELGADLGAEAGAELGADADQELGTAVGDEEEPAAAGLGRARR